MPNVMQNARYVGGVSSAVAAAGDAQATATALTGAINVITSATASSADGVRLPGDRDVGDIVFVVNATTVAVGVYPPTDKTLDGGTANIAKTLTGKTSGFYVSLGSGNWGSILS
jgi:hypothetical protein